MPDLELGAAIRHLAQELNMRANVRKFTIVVESEEDRRRVERVLIQELGGPSNLMMPTNDVAKKGRHFTTIFGVNIVTKWEM